MFPSKDIAVYLEKGQRRTFAGAIDWPGWCRSGRQEESALQTLLDYGPRYAYVLRQTQMGFESPTDLSELRVVERLKGNPTTDFGAPAVPTSSDARPIGQVELERMEVLVRACWDYFDAAAKAAVGKDLRKGPRGGGRDLDQIVRHVLDAEIAYLGRVSRRPDFDRAADSGQSIGRTSEAVVATLKSMAGASEPQPGPRGGSRWTARYFVRRVVWHVLDHAWEIEDRSLTHT